MKNNRRVVITGLGIVSSIGIGWQIFWKNLLAGKSGISTIGSFDTSQYDRHYGGEVKNFNPCDFIDKRRADRMGRASQMAIAASKLALEDAGLGVKALSKERTGVSIGTTMGEPQVLEQAMIHSIPEGALTAKGISVLTYPPNTITLNIAREFKVCRESFLFGNACSAGNYAIGYSYDVIQKGQADMMMTGGVDAFSIVAFTGFNRLLAMAPERCQPFDLNRKGMMLGEGSGILILESLESARKRKAPIYAEMIGYGLSCDASSMTASDGKEIAKATQKALKISGVFPEEVDYISAHGTGTKENDRAECEAFFYVFGQRAKRIPISSIKSMLGHTLGAASAIEAAVCCLAISRGKIPPTMNFETKDPQCDIDCVANKQRTLKIKVALNNSQAFGGNNAALLFRNVSFFEKI